MSETIKEEPKVDESKEGLKIKKKPKKLVDKMPNNIKVDLSKKPEDAVQTQETDGGDVAIEGSENSSDSQEVVEEVRKTEEIETPLTLVEETEVNDLVEVSKEPVQQTEPTQQLPENIEKLVSFMEETGGTVEDYVRLNADYTNVDNDTLVREYYKQTRPHLDHEDVSLLLEDFTYDEELDDEKEIRKKKIAFKEEVGKAKSFLEGLKGKYYDEIKLRPGVTQEQQKAVDFFNRYNEEQNTVKQMHNDFVNRTNNFLTDDFKGFDFTVGDKKFRYGVKNPKQVADAQSDITNFIGTFLDKENKISDLSSYHKALYAARNADTLAQHFYEQGKADAVKDVMAKSKNISTEPRQTAQGEVFVNGLKVKAISGVDSSKLKVKKVTLKN